MSAPDLEIVKAAMRLALRDYEQMPNNPGFLSRAGVDQMRADSQLLPLVPPHPQIGYPLALNARAVANRLRAEADRLRHQGYMIQGAELLSIANQLDPQP